jgi:hypothetical protein
MKTKPDFFLTSTETSEVFELRKCFRLKRIVSVERPDNFLAVKISPVILGQPYGMGANDISEVVLATRHAGRSLFPVNEWPLYVYVCRIINDGAYRLGKASAKDLEIMFWGEIYRIEDEARKVVEDYRKRIEG